MNSINEHNWRKKAACKGMNPEEFFPERGTYSTQTLALRACATCEVTEPCLAFALKFNEPGVWGGTSSRQRRILKRQLSATKSGGLKPNQKISLIDLIATNKN
jgi:WhiB family redox-sensing transcriptional regulator|tara:strand:- start:44 stop:352 length:309 start_codon:yes stop_codon:yes gene_type:complete